MELQLHLIQFYFFDTNNKYEVMCVAFEDGSYAIYVFKMIDDKTKKGIGSFDFEGEPTNADAKEFLIKALS